MHTNIVQGWKTVARGAALLALLVAAQATAGSPETDSSTVQGKNLHGPDRTRSVQGLGSNDAFERRNFRTLSKSQAQPASAGRVFLEDYQRVHQGTSKKYPTEPRILGQDKRRSRN